MPTNLAPMPADQLKKLQRLLAHRGANLGASGPQNDGVDGDWGPRTAAAFDSFLREIAPGVFAPAAPAPPPAPTWVLGPNPLSIPALPAKYRWLADMGDLLPRTIWEGLQEYGVKELAGKANSPVIMGWADEVGLRPKYTADEVPWCGLYAAVVAKRAGKQVPKDPLWALNWMKFGVAVGQPGLGDALPFIRPGGGHVGWYVGEDQTHFHVLQGNANNEVNIGRIEKSRLQGSARRPVYINQPASVRPYILTAAGTPTTTNEA